MSARSLSAFDPTKCFNPPAGDLKKACGRGGGRSLDTYVSGVAVSNDLSGQLNVTTAEGDKITLTANMEANFRAGQYRSHMENGGTTVDINARSIGYSLKKEFNVTVEGDLNADELKDLIQLFRTVSDIFKQYFSGRDEAATAKTAGLTDRFGHLSSLAGLDLNVDVERSVTVVAARYAAKTAGQAGAPAILPSTTISESPSMTEQAGTDTPGAASSTVTAAPSPSADPVAPIQPSASRLSLPQAMSGAAPAPLESMVEQVINAMKESKVESRKLNKYLPRFLDRMSEDLEKDRRDETDAKRKPDTHTSSAALFTYQSTRQTSITLSLHT